jgi:hypothetical protein
MNDVARSLRWTPEELLSPREERLIQRCKKARFFVFLRTIRHQLFDGAFQDELIALYPARTSGSEPPPPALLAAVTLLQAVLGTSDQEAVRLASTDRCWQMVLGTLDATAPPEADDAAAPADADPDAPFAQSTLVEFRARVMRAHLDRRLLDRTVAFARTTRLFGHTALRAAFDASPLFGAGRVEDTFNLLAHAARLVVDTLAARLDRPFAEVAHQAGIPALTASSLKAALDLDWDDATQRQAGLATLVQQVEALGAFLRAHVPPSELAAPPLATQWGTVEQVLAQDVEPDPDDGGPRLKHGVAPDRRISVEDPDMRHGRKSKTKRFDGYKRHVAVDLDTDLIAAVAITRGNRPEGEAAAPLAADLTRQGFTVARLAIDRAYLGTPTVETYRAGGTEVVCRAFPLRNHGRFTKADFVLDLTSQTVTCPAGTTQPLVLGTVVHFPKAACDACPHRAACTTAKGGRSLAIHAAEPHLIELRTRQKTPEGRAALRERTGVEHGLAHVGQTQGSRARYRGERKNLFDLRRHAAARNIHVAMREAA